ncbi:MAG: OmpH family outer membrane protein [Flavobacteriales bacterium]|nr:OmpH family outer membrane protein [Flavobacteriales bacterium]
MKKLIALLIISVGLSTYTFAQKFAYVDTDYILENIPEYQEAQKELDNLSVTWQKQIEAKYAEIDRLYKAYQAEQILLNEDMKAKRENEIIRKEQEVKDFQKDKFGVDGALFKKRQELIQPIQDQIYIAIKEIAEAGSYSVILDRAGQSNILYANTRYDKSDDVLKKLGYSSRSK